MPVYATTFYLSVSIQTSLPLTPDLFIYEQYRKNPFNYQGVSTELILKGIMQLPR